MADSPVPLRRTIRFEPQADIASALRSVGFAAGGGAVTHDGAEIVASPDSDRIELETATASATAAGALDDVAARLADFERTNAARALPRSDTTVDERADAMFTVQPAGSAGAEWLDLAVRCIDLTTLEGDDSPGRVRWLCTQAIEPDPLDPTLGPVAAVCVYPAFVALAKQLTAETGVAVASVAGAFPSGHSSLDVRLADIRDARASGADEIDIVLNRTTFLVGDHERSGDEIRASRHAAGDAHLKVIIEVGELGSDAAIRAATQLAIDAGADVVKTSTGKTPRNASPAAVLAMAEVIAAHAELTGAAVGLKVAGGVRTPEDALGYLSIVQQTLGDEWMTPERFRFGASGLLGNLVAARRDD